MPFPLPFVPKLSYHTGGRRFGAVRANSRKHAGVDLIAPPGTEIFAIEDGQVIEIAPEFYHGTAAIALAHRGFVARYCEVQKDSIKGIRKGQKFNAGDVIAKVGQMFIRHQCFTSSSTLERSRGR